jgi:hypothetical protein
MPGIGAALDAVAKAENETARMRATTTVRIFIVSSC